MEIAHNCKEYYILRLTELLVELYPYLEGSNSTSESKRKGHRIFVMKTLANFTWQNKKTKEILNKSSNTKFFLHLTGTDINNPLVSEWTTIFIRNYTEGLILSKIDNEEGKKIYEDYSKELSFSKRI